ncbi:hypothetical protein BKA23_2650 [Rudaeicoccus suwonensis]|uniref:IPT/TIG domain-containing protein n=1 Tax=Rudaeicoccus suwonensis TaxID=657409 RepID=A0A561E3U8_9MICO|nr:hypothetical protein BKA23_2650 [Rudaeicoccus suwonensis]
MTITGTNLNAASKVMFGQTAGTGLTTVSNTELTVTAPPATKASPVNITVTTTAGTSAIVPVDQFTYTAPCTPGSYVAQKHLSGTLTGSMVWGPACAGVYIIDPAGLQIAPGASLTITAGTIVKYTSNSQVPIGVSADATLTVSGTGGSPAVMTSIDDNTTGGTTGSGDPAASNSPAIDTTSSTAVIDISDLRLRYAGISNDFGALSVTGSSIYDGTVSSDTDQPVEITATSVAYTPTTINYASDPATNGTVGISITAATQNAVTPVITNDSVTGVTGVAYEITEPALLQADVSGDTASNNALNAIGISSGLSGVWTLTPSTLPLLALGTYSPAWGGAGDIEVLQGATLNLTAGTTVKYEPGWMSAVTVDAGGSLNAIGSDPSPVVITSVDDDSVGGTTGSGQPIASSLAPAIDLVAPSSEANLSRTTLKYESLSNDGGTLAVSNSVVYDGDIASQSDQPVTVTGTTVSYAPSTFGGCNSSAQGPGIQVIASTDAADTATVTNNTVSNVDSIAYSVSEPSMQQSDVTGNAASGNAINALGLSGGLNGIWNISPAGIPTALLPVNSGNWSFQSLSVLPQATVNIAPGVVMKSYPTGWSYLCVGGGNYGYFDVQAGGSLNFNGDASGPITLTAVDDNTVGGTTGTGAPSTSGIGNTGDGILLETGSEFAATSLNLKYGQIYNQGGSLAITHSTVYEGQIFSQSNESVAITGTTVASIPESFNYSTTSPLATVGITVLPEPNETAVAPIVTNNTVDDFAGIAYEIEGPDLLQNQLSGNQAVGNAINAFGVAGGLSGAWNINTSELPLALLSISNAWGDEVDITQGAQVSIDAGSVIKGYYNGWCQPCTDAGHPAGFDVQSGGSLSINGSSDNPIVYTSGDDNSVGGTTGTGNPGGTEGIEVDPGGSIAGSNFELKYGGLLFDGSSTELDNVTITGANTAVTVYDIPGQVIKMFNANLNNGSVGASVNIGGLEITGSITNMSTRAVEACDWQSMWTNTAGCAVEAYDVYWGDPNGAYGPVPALTGWSGWTITTASSLLSTSHVCGAVDADEYYSTAGAATVSDSAADLVSPNCDGSATPWSTVAQGYGQVVQAATNACGSVDATSCQAIKGYLTCFNAAENLAGSQAAVSIPGTASSTLNAVSAISTAAGNLNAAGFASFLGFASDVADAIGTVSDVANAYGTCQSSFATG